METRRTLMIRTLVHSSTCVRIQCTRKCTVLTSSKYTKHRTAVSKCVLSMKPASMGYGVSQSKQTILVGERGEWMRESGADRFHRPRCIQIGQSVLTVTELMQFLNTITNHLVREIAIKFSLTLSSNCLPNLALPPTPSTPIPCCWG